MWDKIIVSSPVNRQSAVIASQRGATDSLMMSREEILQIKNRLERKSRSLKHILKISSRTTHKNIIYRINKGNPTERGKSAPRAMIEYVNLGEQINMLNLELKRIREEKWKSKKAT